MTEITLLGNQILVNEDNKQRFPLSESYKFLWSPVEIHASVTVKTLMEILSSNPEFFSMALSEPYLMDLVEHYRDPSFSVQESHILSICFSWIGEHWRRNKEERDFSLILSVFGKNDEIDIWGIEFSPLNSIIDLPISIDKNVVIEYFSSKRHKRKAGELEDGKHELGEQEVYLIELLKAFVSEITFCGTEENKIEEWKSISSMIEDANEVISENGNEDEIKRYTSIEEIEQKFNIDRQSEDSDDLEDLDEEDFNKMMGKDDK